MIRLIAALMILAGSVLTVAACNGNSTATQPTGGSNQSQQRY